MHGRVKPAGVLVVGQQDSRLRQRAIHAMESGVSNHVWSIEELCGLLPKMVNSGRLDKALVLQASSR